MNGVLYSSRKTSISHGVRTLRETSDYYMSPCKVLWGLDKVFVNTQDHKGRSVWIGLLFSYPQLKCLFGVVGLFLMTVENWISLDYIPLVKGCFLPDSVMRIFFFLPTLDLSCGKVIQHYKRGSNNKLLPPQAWHLADKKKKKKIKAQRRQGKSKIRR